MLDAGAKPQLLGFGLTNYRSFGPDGFLLTNLRKVNVLVGKNNAGKSNVLRAIHVLRQLNRSDGGNAFPAVTDRHQRRDVPVEAKVVIPLGPLIPEDHLQSHTGGEILGRTGPSITVHWNTTSVQLLSVSELLC